MEIDHDAGEVVLHEPTAYRYNGAGTVLPVTVHVDQPYVRARLLLAGRDPLEGDFVIDTGLGQTVMLGLGFAESHGFPGAFTRTVAVPAASASGDSQMVMGRLGGLQIGPFVLPGAIAMLPPFETMVPGKAGTIGWNFLRRFRLVVDFPQEQIILEPTARLSESEELDMSGLRLGGEVDSGGLPVTRVLERSPAAEADVRSGDLLLEVDGRAAASIPSTTLRQIFRQAGRAVKLRVKSGTEVRTVLIKTSPTGLGHHKALRSAG